MKKSIALSKSKTEEDNDMYWECCKVNDYYKKREIKSVQIISIWLNGISSLRRNHG
jgi:hypothetical protein